MHVSSSTRVSLLVLLGLLIATSSAVAQPSIPLTIVGNEARGLISLPGGIGADLTLTFESASGLTPSALNVSASLVSPVDLLRLLPRLGDVLHLGLPVGFPVLLRIEPSLFSGLSLKGVVTVSLYTHNLNLDPLLPLSFFSAPLGGPFQDVTGFEGSGSYRAGGTSPGFSEFLIVDYMRVIEPVITGKFDTLQSLLNQHAGSMPASVKNDLQAHLTLARSLYQSGSTVAAIDEITAFADIVKAESGTNIPDVWRAGSSLVNVAGRLRAAADTLKFSLNRKVAGLL